MNWARVQLMATLSILVNCGSYKIWKFLDRRDRLKYEHTSKSLC